MLRMRMAPTPGAHALGVCARPMRARLAPPNALPMVDTSRVRLVRLRRLHAGSNSTQSSSKRIAIATQANLTHFQQGNHADNTKPMEVEEADTSVWSLWNPWRLQRSARGKRMSLVAKLRHSAAHGRAVVLDMTLPRDYKHTVTSDYMPYTKWNFVGSVASTACGILSTQAMLYAVGLGSGAIPTAAAINWVLKDGLGQFGGIVFASLVNNRYDGDPKRWRMVSALALDVAEFIEILTPLVPALFLPMASIANIGKYISWLSAGATRAGIHSSFTKSENLAEITAKSGSQNIFASVVGTGLGIVISHFTGASTAYLLAAFTVLAVGHEITTYESVASVSLRTLNMQRLHYLIQTFVTSNGSQLPHPDQARQDERLLSTMLRGFKSDFTRSFVNGETPLKTLAPTLQDLLTLRETFSQDKYLLHVKRLSSDMYRIDLAMEESAMMEDVLLAHLHAVMIQEKLETQSEELSAAELAAMRNDCYRASKATHTDLVHLLDKSEWHSHKLLVEEKGMRYRWAVDQ